MDFAALQKCNVPASAIPAFLADFITPFKSILLQKHSTVSGRSEAILYADRNVAGEVV